MLDEWEMLYLGTGIVMCRRITTDRMSDSSGVHGGHGGIGAGEQVQVHANVPGGRGNMAPPSGEPTPPARRVAPRLVWPTSSTSPLHGQFLHFDARGTIRRIP